MLAGTFRRVNLLTYLHVNRIVNGTGVGRVARHLAEELAQHPGVNLRILAEAGCYARFRPQLGEPLVSMDHCLFRASTSTQQAQWLVARRPVAEEFWPDCDVVWCPAESYVPARSAALVVTVHDLAYFEKEAVGTWRDHWVQRLKWQYLFRVLARRADVFHTVSAFSAERLSHFFPSVSSRIRIVPNAVTPRFLQPVSAAGQSALERLALAQRYILLPGGLNWKKNTDLVLAAWPRIRAACRGVELVTAGTSDASYVEAMSGQPGVKQLGYVDDELLRSLYAGASVVWVPSRYEGFAIPVLEAMASGVPVVASRAGAIPEVAGDAALLAPPDSMGAHVDAILSFLRDERLSGDFKNRGLQRVSAFSWKASAAQMLALMRSMSAGHCRN
jgi:glycosyltransferase involved in cell wall biosynthesis